jgi:ABC-type polysaccharide/polyol phosphate transport system ATPase subunit
MPLDIEFRNVTKAYRSREIGNLDLPAKKLWQRWFPPRTNYKALNQVSFAVERGEALGIIGHNGAGKSTILKVLSRITSPTAGEIVVTGSLSALIEVSSGFHPDLTGRENVFLNGAIFGMTRKEIAGKLNSIVEFSGIGEFIDVPIKRYSSGMHLRLAFSVAAHLTPDILLLDEVLAVGDFAFQRKCLARVDQLKRDEKTIVFISHDLAAVERLCDRVLLMSHGEIAREGKPRDVIPEYQKFALTASQPPVFAGKLSGLVKCTGFSYASRDPAHPEIVRTGEAMTMTVDFVAHQAMSGLMVNVYLFWPSGYLCAQLSTDLGGITVAKGTGRIEFDCPVVNLCHGLFLVDVSIERPPEVIDLRYRCAYLRVDPGNQPSAGDLYMAHSWRRCPMDEREAGMGTYCSI